MLVMTVRAWCVLHLRFVYEVAGLLCLIASAASQKTVPAGKRSEQHGRTKLPEIDLDELKKFKEQNFRERLEFLD
jgi:hypothetical protein